MPRQKEGIMRILESLCPWCGAKLIEDISGLIYCENDNYDTSYNCGNCVHVDSGVCSTAGEVSSTYTCKEFKLKSKL
jgi:predicted RNA-binding Zn-ribbon protein involved in translation (DUF1610 family)